MGNRSLALGLALALSVFIAAPRPASACGGCAGPPETSTQVTGHRMVFSVSKTQTTLIDQIEYAGNPESFAWFLPIAGEVDVGLSSDVLFEALGVLTSIAVYPPLITCDNYTSAFGGAEDGSSGGEGLVALDPEQDVDILAQEVVGPYETVQIASDTPGALAKWLTDHGYAVSGGTAAVIDAYQSEGFAFLAMKLVPGGDVRAMQPVRVTSAGASLTLPLRMVAAGTGAITPVSLFVLGEGRYEAASAPNRVVPPEEIVWDWDSQSSNYSVLRDRIVDDTAGYGWLTEKSYDFWQDGLLSTVQDYLAANPGTSGWGDPAAGVSELEGAEADIARLLDGMAYDNTWVTRMYARLSRPALATDLQLAAAEDQSQVYGTYLAERSIGLWRCPSDGRLECSVRPGAGGRSSLAAFSMLALGLGAALHFLRRAARRPPSRR